MKIFFMFLMILILVAACEAGQSRVDAWEQQTGRYGEGLR